MTSQLSAFAATVSLAAHAVFAVASVWLVRIDLREHRLPNRVLAAATGAVLGCLVWSAGLSNEWPRLGAALSAAIMYGTVFFVLWLFGRGSLGAGDLKLSPLLGLVAGWAGVDTAALWVPLGVAVVGAAAAILAHLRTQREFAFGPPMIIGTWLGLVSGLLMG